MCALKNNINPENQLVIIIIIVTFNLYCILIISVQATTLYTYTTETMNTTEILDTTEMLNTTETTDPGIASSVIIAAAISAAVAISILIISIGLCIVVANKYTKTSESDTDHYYETPGFSVTSSSGVNNTPSSSVIAGYESPDVVTQNTAYATVGVINEEEVPTQNTHDEAFDDVMTQNTAYDIMTQNTAMTKNTAYPTALHAGDEAPDAMTKNTAYPTALRAGDEAPDVMTKNTAYPTALRAGDEIEAPDVMTKNTAHVTVGVVLTVEVPLV